MNNSIGRSTWAQARLASCASSSSSNDRDEALPSGTIGYLQLEMAADMTLEVSEETSATTFCLGFAGVSALKPLGHHCGVLASQRTKGNLDSAACCPPQTVTEGLTAVLVLGRTRSDVLADF